MDVYSSDSTLRLALQTNSDRIAFQLDPDGPSKRISKASHRLFSQEESCLEVYIIAKYQAGKSLSSLFGFGRIIINTQPVLRYAKGKKTNQNSGCGEIRLRCQWGSGGKGCHSDLVCPKSHREKSNVCSCLGLQATCTKFTPGVLSKSQNRYSAL